MGSGGPGSQMQKPQHLGNAACLLYRVELRGGVIYCIQLNKEAELVSGAQLDQGDRFDSSQ